MCEACHADECGRQNRVAWGQPGDSRASRLGQRPVSTWAACVHLRRCESLPAAQFSHLYVGITVSPRADVKISKILLLKISKILLPPYSEKR